MAKAQDIKEIVASNIIRYRKSADLTQAQLAEKINYSDKAVSKWERGEALPDVYVLKSIADICHVNLDDMLHEETTMEKLQSFYKNRTVVAILSALLVWLIAVIAFVVIELIIPNTLPTWLAFIYAIPVSFIVALVFNNIWGGRIYNMLIVSGLNWGIAVSLVLSLGFISNIHEKIWYLYFVSAILEIMIILWYFLDPSAKTKKEKPVKAALPETKPTAVKDEVQNPKEPVQNKEKADNKTPKAE